VDGKGSAAATATAAAAAVASLTLPLAGGPTAFGVPASTLFVTCGGCRPIPDLSLLLLFTALEEEVQVAIQTNTQNGRPHSTEQPSPTQQKQRFLGNTRTKTSRHRRKPNIGICGCGKCNRLGKVPQTEGQESGADFRCREMSLVQSNNGKFVHAL
jgi:hypothetical protein